MKFISSFFLLLLTKTLFAQTLTSQNVEVKTDLEYKSVGSWKGKLDLYVPKQQNKKPLVIYIHGGGWTHGKKEAEYEKIKIFINNDFAVANIEYRLAPLAAAPAAIEDVHCAVTFLKKNAAALGLKGRKMVLMGASAGAHLALMAGLQSNKPVYTGNCKSRFSVAAIISKYGPTDLLTWEPATKEGSASAGWLGTRQKDTTFIKSLSPTSYVSGKKIPILFIHGDQDKTVPIDQSLKLFEKLQQKHYPTELYVVKGGKHGNFGDEETAKMDSKMLDFLSEYVN